MSARSTSGTVGRFALMTAPAALLIAASPVLAAEQENTPPAHAHGAQATTSTTSTQQPMDMDPNMPMPPGSDHSGHSAAQSQTAEQPTDMGSMDMGSMQGGRPPADARDPDAHADGYENSTLPGFEKTDQLPVSMVLVDQAEFISGNEGDGFSWSAQIANGGDNDKLWLRSQGLKISGERLDPYTGAEALWWHAYSPFWGRTLGVRQDIGRGAHTWLALGIEGLAPYWFDVELTGYVSDGGHFSARVKASYDMLLTNRLIMTPSMESNIFSKKQKDRQLGGGISNLELGLRVRYEIKRKFAPYVGFVWERSFGDTADFKRAAGDPVTERRFVAGVRLWW